MKDLPWSHDPRGCNHPSNDSSMNVDTVREELSSIIGERNGIGRPIRTNLCDDSSKANEECSSSFRRAGRTVSSRSQSKRVPDIGSVNNFG